MKYNFGDYSVLGSTTYAFKKAPGWWWKIKPITSGMELEMQKFLYRNRTVVDEHGNRISVPPLNLEIAHREIALLFGGTNIPKNPDQPVEMGGEPVLKDDATVEEITNVLIWMPREMIEEIWYAIAEANPDTRWGPELPKASTKSE